MKLLEALMPTHAKVATLVTEAPVPAIHKYVVLQADNGREQVIVFDREIQHSHMVPLRRFAVSAGFVVIGRGIVRIVAKSGSESLGLDARPEDQALLQKFLSSPL